MWIRNTLYRKVVIDTLDRLIDGYQMIDRLLLDRILGEEVTLSKMATVEFVFTDEVASQLVETAVCCCYPVFPAH